jgi:hypothetical protein
MYKAKSASMKRGAQRRERVPLSAEELRLFTKTKISEQELSHFSFGERTRDAFLGELEPIIHSYAKGGFQSPKDISRLLNKNGWKTACGDQWSPQLAWFLLGFLFDRRKARNKLSPAKPSVRSSSGADPNSKAPLTREELVRRLSALGRIK